MTDGFGTAFSSNLIINENDGSSKTMYPNEARLKNLTYKSSILCNIGIHYIPYSS